PFTPASKSYTIQNVEDVPLEYSVSANQPWVSVTNATGVIAPDETTEVTVLLNANAAALPNGVYSATVSFTNLTNGLGNTSRNVSLDVGRIVYPSTDTPI